MKEKKGFALFSPMAGTLIILITMLIVSSIIIAERTNLQGTIQNYRSQQIASISQEVQSRIQEETRNTITAELSQVTGSEPLMQITIFDCPSENIETDFYPETNYCAKRIDEQMNQVPKNRLGGIALINSTINNAITRVIKKHEDMTIKPLNTDLSKLLQDITMDNEGRVQVDIDFGVLKDTPIAEVTTESQTLQIFLPDVKKQYLTDDPYGKYAQMTGKIFQDFQLLNYSWHGAGGNTNYDFSDTDGSEWYHYNYVLHERKTAAPPGTYTKQKMSTENNFGFSNVMKKDIFDAFKNNNDLAFLLSDSYGSYGLDYSSGREELRLDSFNSDLKEFINGYYILHTDTPIKQQSSNPSSMKSFSGVGDTGTFIRSNYLPGGCLTGFGSCEDSEYAGSTTSGTGVNGLYSFASNNNFNFTNENDQTQSLTAYTTSDIVVNTTKNYDEKLVKGMKEHLDNLRAEVNSNNLLKSAMGLDKVEYRLVVKSEQYFSEGELNGGDNFRCGQFFVKYVPPLPGDSVISAWDNPWFVSLPINYTCKSKVLYGVKETYLLYRNDPDNPDERSKLVFKSTFIRRKDDYKKISSAGQNYVYEDASYHDRSLWFGSPEPEVNLDSEDENVIVRKCTYEYDTVSGMKPVLC